LKLKIYLYLVVFFISALLLAGNEIPSCLTSYKFGPQQHIIIVEKASQSLFIYSNYKAEPVEKFTITTGKVPGKKFEEGDMKTPEGIYFFKRVITGTELPKIDDYGEKAFTLNYPNSIDEGESRTGSGIWLHGAYDINKTENPNNSRGCVVMNNEDLMKVSRYIFLDQTPIVIYDKIEYDSVAEIKERRDRFIRDLTDWKKNWENKNITGYIDYYEKDFQYSGMGLSAFKSYKKNLNKLYKFIKIILSKINIYSFDNYFVVIFNQLYISDINHFYSKKIQYWENHRDKAKIASELNIRLPQITRFEITKGNYVSLKEFRKDYCDRMTRSTVNFIPGEINLKKVSIFDNSVKVFLKKTGPGSGLRVIPVLLLKNNGSTEYDSLPGIVLESGVPQNQSKGIILDNQEEMILLEKEKDAKIKSLTLFVINNEDKFEQIITYFVNK
jgi:murein L,D-transpeptidase YafK